MTDKIIIDGIDVSECEYCGYDNVCKLKSASNYIVDCKENPNCYYKQSKRKEQECEEKDKSIKFLLEKLDLSNNRRQDCELHWDKERKELKQQLDQLKAENERLKKEIRLYDCIDKWGTEQCHCACRCLGNEFCDEAGKKINKYKQTLTEIKEIAEEARTKVFVDMEEFWELILQKISEVENG